MSKKNVRILFKVFFTVLFLFLLIVGPIQILTMLGAILIVPMMFVLFITFEWAFLSTEDVSLINYIKHWPIVGDNECPL